MHAHTIQTILHYCAGAAFLDTLFQLIFYRVKDVQMDVFPVKIQQLTVQLAFQAIISIIINVSLAGQVACSV